MVDENEEWIEGLVIVWKNMISYGRISWFTNCTVTVASKIFLGIIGYGDRAQGTPRSACAFLTRPDFEYHFSLLEILFTNNITILQILVTFFYCFIKT